MKHEKMARALFKGPVEKVLPEGFDENLIESFFNGSERAVVALFDADAHAPADIAGNVTGEEPVSTEVPETPEEGGGAKPNWAKGGDNTTVEATEETTETNVSSGGKGNGRKKKDAVQSEPAPEEEPAPADETTAGDTSVPDAEPEPVTDPDPAPEPVTEPVATAAPTSNVDFVSGLDTPDGFNVWIDFKGDWTASQRQDVEAAAELISDIVIGDVADSNGIDDLMISAQLTSIDGSDGFWGWGGYTSTRADNRLPVDGYLRLDTADIAKMESYGVVDDFAFHEMLHAMGFGTAWSGMGLVETVDGSLRFTGENATLAYNNEFAAVAGSDSLSAFGVPVEMEGGSGTQGVHWDHDTFGEEMMTGQLGFTNVVSDMTIAALEDMGYQTVFDPDMYGYA